MNQTLGARSGVNVRADDFVRIVHDLARIVGKDDLRLRTLLFNQLFIVIDIIHVGEGMLGLAEQSLKFRLRQNILVRVNALFVQKVEVQQMVTYLVARIAEHQYDLLRALRDAAQTDRETVAAEDREHHADGLAAELCLHILRELISRRVVSLRARQNRLCNCEHILAANFKLSMIHAVHKRIDYDFSEVIAFFDNRCTQTAGHRSDSSCHHSFSFAFSCRIRSLPRLTFSA